ncbi:MAG: N-acetylmuramoyl-L-alanine amidase [Olsenella uli]|uniref:N-acetylmuramoyl-L-alanine amidase n=1 Tax=Olsenella uli TaxID=133926 RepID=UPI001D8235E1|nr:N-acetylmuramoyl-L-alanine amidase [Olsenella uli]MBS6417319.1 N-acetylmuramoyl-L-alanine amidase [Olsenella uli]
MRSRRASLLLVALVLVTVLGLPSLAWAIDAGDAETAPVSDEDIEAISTALQPPAMGVRSLRSTGSSSTGDFVVAIDAGHGGNDPGALGNGMRESDLTLRMAQAARDELVRNGVNVCMIREGDTYVFSPNVSLELQARTTKAHNAGADVYVSLHINSGGGSGAEVWYPRTDISYRPECGTTGRGLAGTVLSRLTDGSPFGIRRRGIFERKNVESTYPDGSLSDWYAVIRHSREYGFPGIIVEHGFIDNYSDAVNLNRYAEAMGRADADAVIDYFGLGYRWVRSEDGQHWMLKGGAGYVYNAWKHVGNAWYYFDDNGYALTGRQSIGGAQYWFDDSCAMVTGWSYIDDSWYYFADSGAMQTGWQKLGGLWYYLDPSTGAMLSGWQQIGGSRYYLSDSGSMLTGWQLVDGSWYYLEPSGAMATGWHFLGGLWYYLDPSTGAMARGWAWDGTGWYWLDGSGAMFRDGWKLIGGSWYLFEKSGAMQTGWRLVGGVWYYLSPSGAMATGWQNVDGSWYWFGSSGAMATGWQHINGIWYYLGSSGAMQTGWQRINGPWYYLEPSGAMAIGWRQIDGSWYYLGPSGAMVTGWMWDGAVWWQLGSSGAWSGVSQRPQSIMGSSTVSADQMAAAYRAAVGAATYPSATYAPEGAETIDRFCQILLEEARTEGVRAEVAFMQAMLETGWLKFGGDVCPEQCNFAGIGAVGGGVHGNDFRMDLNGDGASDGVRAGLRAQVQHLKAYASASALVNPCIDPRYHYVNHGSITDVQGLGIPDYPQGIGWAGSAGYGMDIVSLENRYFGLGY